jgi:hypothetical protein
MMLNLPAAMAMIPINPISIDAIARRLNPR